MHTFMRRKGKWAVGMWLPTNDGRGAAWNTIVVVDTPEMKDVLRVVSVLNGGSGEIGHLHGITLSAED